MRSTDGVFSSDANFCRPSNSVASGFYANDRFGVVANVD